MVIFHSYVSLPEGKPPFSHGFPMVFPWFSYGFPRGSTKFNHQHLPSLACRRRHGASVRGTMGKMGEERQEEAGCFSRSESRTTGKEHEMLIEWAFVVIEWDFTNDWMGFCSDWMEFYSDWMRRYSDWPGFEWDWIWLKRNIILQTLWFLRNRTGIMIPNGFYIFKVHWMEVWHGATWSHPLIQYRI